MNTPVDPPAASAALHVFAGPTLQVDRVYALAPSATAHPPVRHGDLLRLAVRPGDVVVLIDGLWHQVPPVRHKEILELLTRGVRVVGAASMGAIRAAELAFYGMIGIGWVYEQYLTGRIDADDEVAVTQTPDGHPLSTALVCIRYVLEAATDADIIAGRDATQLLGLAQAIPYHRRSWRALDDAAAHAGLTDAHQRLTAWRDQHPAICDIKAVDAETAVRQAAADQLPAPTASAEWRDHPWRTSHLRRWVATYRPAAYADEAYVPLLAVLHYAQLYDTGFPARWRRHVLAWIADGTPGSEVDLEDQALASASGRGLVMDSLTPAQVEYWATPAEILGLCQRELLLRIITRSARMDPTASVWPETPDEARPLLDLRTSARAAVRAWTTNERIAATGPGRTTDHLNADRIRAHLADHWGADPADTAALTAAGRDRGILSLEEAVQMARPFYLAARACLTNHAAMG